MIRSTVNGSLFAVFDAPLRIPEEARKASLSIQPPLIQDAITMVTHDSIEPLSGSVEVLYAVYLEIAKRDHRCRLQALYGSQIPPPGHTPFRPLPLKYFKERLISAQANSGGEQAFRKQLSRWAKVYGVDCVEVVARRLAA